MAGARIRPMRWDYPKTAPTSNTAGRWNKQDGQKPLARIQFASRVGEAGVVTTRRLFNCSACGVSVIEFPNRSAGRPHTKCRTCGGWRDKAADSKSKASDVK